MASSYFFIMSLLSPSILLLASLVGLFKLKMMSRSAMVIWLYAIGCLCIDVLSRSVLSEENNLYIIPWLSLFELIMFGIFYYLRQRNIVLVLLYLIGVIYVTYEINYINEIQVENYQPYARTISSLIIVVSAMNGVIIGVKSTYSIPERRVSLNVLVLIYFLFQLICLLPMNYLVNESSSLIEAIWLLNLGVHFLFYSYLLYFLWKSGRQTKPLLFG